MRRPVDVMAVTDDLVPDVVAMWLASKQEMGLVGDAARAASESRLVSALGRPEVHAWVALLDGAAIGYVVTSENAFGLAPTPELAVEQLFVYPEYRHCGVAKTLLFTVVGHAERTGCDVIVGNVPATSRDANRFFARLGFGSILVRRVASTAQLHRRLAGEGGPSAVEQVVRRRRSLRAVRTRTRSA